MHHKLTNLDWVSVARRNGFDIAVAAGCTFLFLRALICISGYGFDDSYITYTISQNLSDGTGLVFNPGVRLQVSTSPLYTLYLAFFAALGGDIPVVSRVSSAVFYIIAVLVLLALGRRLKLVWPARIAAVFLALNPDVLRTYGHETPLYILLMLSAVCCYSYGRAMLASSLCALLLLCRGDGILLSVILFAGFIIRNKIFPWKQLLLYVGIAAPWFVFSTAYFGSPLPTTLSAKIQQHSIMSNYPSFFNELHRLITQGGAAAVIQVFVAGLGGLTLLKRTPELVAWVVAYIAGYCALRVSGVFFWWYVPLYPVAFLCYGAGVYSIIKRLSTSQHRRAFKVVVVTVVALATIIHGAWLQRNYKQRYDKYIDTRIGEKGKTSKVNVYRHVGQRWMKPCMKPGESLAMTEIGGLGYYGRRTILDLFGLASPEVLPYLRKSPRDKSAVIFQFKPEYFGDFSWRNWIHDIRNVKSAKNQPQRNRRRWVRTNYRMHRRISVRSKYATATFLIYRRNDLKTDPGCGR